LTQPPDHELNEELLDVPVETPQPDLHKPEVIEVAAEEIEQEANVVVRVYKQLIHLSQQIYKQGLWLTLVESVEQIRRVINGAPTRKFSELGGGLHLGGQYFRYGWPELQARGITAVVCMRKEFDDAKAKLAPPRYLYLPTQDNTAPSLEHLRQGVKFIDEELRGGGQVYIHCWEGVGRAPTMAAAYLVSKGLTPEESWAKIQSVRPFIRPSILQVRQLERFAAEVQNSLKSP
jgi:hypothetical protein